ncbi:glutamate racemase [Butyrivibrio proteoclasticus]|uniref:glutamate racemase n=1 Tax=Butyrivibrio proteoclasticus TaxID=43305 RepID=UPI00047C55A6|nr:glutamate racemase [Butyrivibrio proteoclasticus]
MKIGIFDSGIGGLSLLHEAYHMLPQQNYIFYADTEHVPYGTKTPEQIIDYATDIADFLVEKDVEAIVVACNTATSVAIKELRKRYSIPILGMEPAVKPAVEETSRKRIMVIATPVTIREDKLKDLLHRVDGEHRVDLLAMPKLVEFAEREEFDSEDVHEYLRQQFSQFNKDEYCAIVLGCTHFNYFKPAYREYFGEDILLVDGNYGTIHHLADVLSIPLVQDKEVYFETVHNMLYDNNTEYYFSKKSIKDEKTLEHLKRLHNRLEEVRKF